MKIHAITVVKNEADIIQHTLREALKWADYIYVLENGSEDETWERVQELASDRIIPWKRDDKPFLECVRGEVFNQFKSRAELGDWWCRLDGDEVYSIQSPRDFLPKVAPAIHVVWAIYVDYYITKPDLETLDFSLPAADVIGRLRYYRANYSECRFFRHRPKLIWPPDGSWPLHMGITNKERILFKHYKYRSPVQMQTRLDTRRRSRENGHPGWDSASALDWKETIADAADCHYDKGTGRYEVDWHLLPDHLDSSKKRMVKKVLHGLGIWP